MRVYITVIMTQTYWGVGRRIVEHEQQGEKRAVYGEALVERLGSDLTAKFGRGFSQSNLWQMRDFYLAWPILQTASGESRTSRPISGDAPKSRHRLDFRVNVRRHRFSDFPCPY